MIKDVRITVSRETAPITQAGFGLPLIVGVDDNVDFKLCTSTGDVDDAGFDSSTDVYKMAAKMLAQEPAPQQIAVAGAEPQERNATVVLESEDGARIHVEATGDKSGDDGNDEAIEIVNEGDEFEATHGDEGNGGTITVDLAGTERSAADIAHEIDSLSDFEAYVLDGGYFDPDMDLQDKDFEGGEDSSLAAALDELVDKGHDFYFILADTREESDVREIASWAGANDKMYVASPDRGVSEMIDLQKDIASDRVVLFYHDDPEEFLDAAVVGRCAPEDPGTITWKFKTLNDVALPEVTATDMQKLYGANINTYVEKLGVPQTSDGLTTVGEYIDVIRGQDYVQVRLNEDLHQLLFNAPRVPFDSRGIAQVKAAIRSRLIDAADMGIIAQNEDGRPMFTVETPRRAEIPEADLANRRLRNVEFEYTTAGAVHYIEVHGVVTV